MLTFMQLIIISGLSGSGKSIALNMLEDADYYCVDNMPSQLLQQLVDQLAQQGYDKVAVAIDIRGGKSIAMLPQQLASLRANELFRDAPSTSVGRRTAHRDRSHCRRAGSS